MSATFSSAESGRGATTPTSRSLSAPAVPWATSRTGSPVRRPGDRPARRPHRRVGIREQGSSSCGYPPFGAVTRRRPVFARGRGPPRCPVAADRRTRTHRACLEERTGGHRGIHFVLSLLVVTPSQDTSGPLPPFACAPPSTPGGRTKPALRNDDAGSFAALALSRSSVPPHPEQVEGPVRARPLRWYPSAGSV